MLFNADVDSAWVLSPVCDGLQIACALGRRMRVRATAPANAASAPPGCRLRAFARHGDAETEAEPELKGSRRRGASLVTAT